MSITMRGEMGAIHKTHTHTHKLTPMLHIGGELCARVTANEEIDQRANVEQH